MVAFTCTVKQRTQKRVATYARLIGSEIHHLRFFAIFFNHGQVVAMCRFGGCG